MSTALEILGPRLRSLPDGETGERRNWVISIIDGLRDHPDLEVVKAGDWSDYDKIPVLRVRRGHTLYGANLDFGHVAAVRESYPVFERLRGRRDVPDLVFQEGVPGDFDLAMFTLGPAGALRHRRAFTEATLTEIREVGTVTGPTRCSRSRCRPSWCCSRRPRRRPARRWRRCWPPPSTGWPPRSPPGTRFGVHLCLGDMNNKAFGTMSDVSPLVAAGQRDRAWLARRSAARRTCTRRSRPPTSRPRPTPRSTSRWPELALPSGTRFAAGFAHESQSLDDQLAIRGADRGASSAARSRSSAACGLGRRTPERRPRRPRADCRPLHVLS